MTITNWEPCSSCRWRKDGGIVSNHEWRKKLWNGQGLSRWMICHQYLAGKPGARRAHHCAGAMVLAQREVLRYHQTGRSAMPEEAIVNVARLMVPDRIPLVQYDAVDRVYFLVLRFLKTAPFSEIPRQELLDGAHPCLADPEIAHNDLAPPRPGEFA